jgi:hypothetical protein
MVTVVIMARDCGVWTALMTMWAGGKPTGVDLMAVVPGLTGLPLEGDQVAQIDSKDMSLPVWQTSVRRRHHLARPEVGSAGSHTAPIPGGNRSPVACVVAAEQAAGNTAMRPAALRRWNPK